jgi:hypothetical protein
MDAFKGLNSLYFFVRVVDFRQLSGRRAAAWGTLVAVLVRWRGNWVCVCSIEPGRQREVTNHPNPAAGAAPPWNFHVG